MHIKDYLRPPEAAEYLSKKIGQSCSKADLYDLIRDHHLTLLLRFKGYLGLPGPIEDDGYNPTDGVFPGLPFDGYLSCPDQRFLGFMESEREQTLWYLFRVYSNVTGVFESAIWDESAPLEGYVLGTRSEGHTHEGHAGYVTPEWLYPKFKADRDLFICRAELYALIAQHQADSTPAPAPVAASEPAPQDTEAQQPTAIEEWPVTGNIERRNQIKQDLQGMARIIDAHWWSSDTAQTTTGEMADRVYREVGKFAPDGFMPETVEAVRDWIKPLAPEYARKPGRRKTP